VEDDDNDNNNDSNDNNNNNNNNDDNHDDFQEEDNEHEAPNEEGPDNNRAPDKDKAHDAANEAHTNNIAEDPLKAQEWEQMRTLPKAQEWGSNKIWTRSLMSGMAPRMENTIYERGRHVSTVTCTLI
jgi:hypothetical protein